MAGGTTWIHMLMKVNFVSFGTENCEELLERFYAGLIRSCKEDFVLHYYSINYESKVTGERLVSRKIETRRKYERGVYYKPLALIRSLIDVDSTDFIYLDLDILLTKKFSSVELFSKIEDSETPLSPNHFWENPFFFAGENTTPMGESIAEMKSIQRCCPYVQNCLIVYQKRHLDFLLDWMSLIHDGEVSKIMCGDEEVYNVSLWGYGQTKTLGYICVTNGTVDVDGLGRFGSIERAYQKFESGEFDSDMLTDRNNFYLGFDPEKVMIFHGIK
jgi:hypothetical protein